MLFYKTNQPSNFDVQTQAAVEITRRLQLGRSCPPTAATLTSNLPIKIWSLNATPSWALSPTMYSFKANEGCILTRTRMGEDKAASGWEEVLTLLTANGIKDDELGGF